MLKSSLSDYCDAYTIVKEIITIAGAGADAAVQRAGKINKQVMFKGCGRNIFASLFFKSFQVFQVFPLERTCGTWKNVFFLFHLRNSFHSGENQLLVF